MKEKILLFFLLTIFLFLRLPNLKSDPPSVIASISRSASIYCDEGMYPHNARNKILFNKWITDEWNPFIYNPVLTLTYYITFLIFGVKITVVKIITILISLISFFFFLKIIENEEKNLLISFMVSILFSLNFYLIAYSRVGLLENFSIFSFILTFYFFIKSEKNPTHAIGVGVFTAISILSKYLFIYFFFVSFISIFLLSMKKREKKILINFFVGFISIFFLWLSIIYIPNIKYFSKIGSAWGKQSIPFNFYQLFLTISHNSIPRYFSLFPIIFLSGLFFVSFIITKIIFRGKTKSKEIFLFLWIVFSFFQIGILRYQPLRYYLPLVPALYLSLFYLIMEIQKEEKKMKFQLITIIITGLFIFLFFKKIIKNLFVYPSAFFIYPQFLRIAFFISLAIFILLFIFKIPKKKFSILFLILMLTLISGQIMLFSKYILHPTYNLLKASNYGDKLDKKSFIVGQCSLRVFFDSGIKAIPAYKNWFNDSNLFTKYPITHLLMLKKFHELRWIKQKYPFVTDKLKIIRRFHLWDTELQLYKYNNRRKNE